MKRSHALNMLLSVVLVVWLSGCVHTPPKPVPEEVPMVQEPAPSQHMVLLREAREEAEHLRAEVASLKILMAKQAGELQSLREQSQTVQDRERGQGKELQNIRSELLSSQAERNQLRQRNAELEGQLGGLANTTQLVTELRALQASFQQIMTNINSVANDLMLIKKEMRITGEKLKPRQIKMTGKPTVKGGAIIPTPDSKGRIVIQEGDTLWKLANRYDVTVDQLKEWNHLSSDLIMSGLRLQVSVPPVSESVVLPHPSEPDLAAPVQEKTSSSGGKATAPSNPVENRTEVPTSEETKNMLSVSTP